MKTISESYQSRDPPLTVKVAAEVNKRSAQKLPSPTHYPRMSAHPLRKRKLQAVLPEDCRDPAHPQSQGQGQTPDDGSWI